MDNNTLRHDEASSTKACTRCKAVLSASAFPTIKVMGKRRLASWCRGCRSEAAREHRKRKPEQYREADRRRYAARMAHPGHKAYHREYQRKHRKTDAGKVEIRKNRLRAYKLTVEDFDRMLAKQDGKCAICKQRPSKVLNVDHCHRTGAVRGLLCSACNRGLGAFRDCAERLSSAIAYLSETRQVASDPRE